MTTLMDLETWLLRKRRVGAILLDADMYERWGAQHDTDEGRAQMEARARAAETERAEAVKRLTELVAELRRDDPALIARWAELHIALLRDIGSDDTTAAFVANEERAAWAAVARGEKAFVEENFFYVKIDPARYEAIFGFPLPA